MLKIDVRWRDLPLLIGATAVTVGGSGLSAGCVALIDFNRSLIEAGVDASVDGGDGSLSVDATIDPVGVTDAAVDGTSQGMMGRVGAVNADGGSAGPAPS